MCVKEKSCLFGFHLIDHEVKCFVIGLIHVGDTLSDSLHCTFTLQQLIKVVHFNFWRKTLLCLKKYGKQLVFCSYTKKCGADQQIKKHIDCL